MERTTSRLGLGLLGAALYSAALISPALAVEPKPGDKNPTIDPSTIPPQMTPADVDVDFLYTSHAGYKPGDPVHYVFRITNHGPGTAHDVKVNLWARAKKAQNQAEERTVYNENRILTLAPGGGSVIQVVCDPEPDEFCSYARVLAPYGNDSNHNNNSAGKNGH